MLTIAAALVGLWFLGLMAEITMGGMIHLLLVAGLVLALTKIIQEATPEQLDLDIEPETV
jgi:predicted phage tail protein